MAAIDVKDAERNSAATAAQRS